MNKAMIKNGFIAAGLMNIGGVLLFSRAFTNEALNQADSVVMSNFGLLMIVVWGLAYISVCNAFEKARWLVAVFAIEKLVYVTVWGMWIADNDLNSLYSQDLFAGVFYTIYGPNDILFMLFFSWVFFRTKGDAN